MGPTTTHISIPVREQTESARIYTGGVNRSAGEHPVLRMAVTRTALKTATVVFEDELWLVRWTSHHLADYELYMKMSDWQEIHAKIQKLKPSKNRMNRGLGYTP